MRPSTHACRSSDLDTPATSAGVSKRDVTVSCAVGSGIWSALAEVAQAATPTLSNMKIPKVETASDATRFGEWHGLLRRRAGSGQAPYVRNR
jgi:hypothetical protein